MAGKEVYVEPFLPLLTVAKRDPVWHGGPVQNTTRTATSKSRGTNVTLLDVANLEHVQAETHIIDELAHDLVNWDIALRMKPIKSHSVVMSQGELGTNAGGAAT